MNDNNEEYESIEVQPTWYLKGHTLGWIIGSVILMPTLIGFITIIKPILTYMRRNRTRYALNEGRLHMVEVEGIFPKEQTKQIPVRDINDISTSAGYIERKIGVGTITFSEGDGAYSEIKLSGIPRHKELAEEIGRQQNRQAKETRYR